MKHMARPEPGQTRRIPIIARSNPGKPDLAPVGWSWVSSLISDSWSGPGQSQSKISARVFVIKKSYRNKQLSLYNNKFLNNFTLFQLVSSDNPFPNRSGVTCLRPPPPPPPPPPRLFLACFPMGRIQCGQILTFPTCISTRWLRI